ERAEPRSGPAQAPARIAPAQPGSGRRKSLREVPQARPGDRPCPGKLERNIERRALGSYLGRAQIRSGHPRPSAIRYVASWILGLPAGGFPLTRRLLGRNVALDQVGAGGNAATLLGGVTALGRPAEVGI